MKYYICHQTKHISQDKDCARTPYSDESLYDSACWPKELTLVGLRPDVEHGELPKFWHCTTSNHSGLRCRDNHTRLQIHSDAYGMTGHNWQPVYKTGDWVLIRARVDFSVLPQHTQIRVGASENSSGHFYVPRKSVVGLAQIPIPDEPNRSSLLRPKGECDSGDLIVFDHGGWKPMDDPERSGLEWRDAWTKWGPFDRFEPAGEIT